MESSRSTDFALLLWGLKHWRFVANDIFVALNMSQSQMRHNFTLRVSTEVIESRILSSIYIYYKLLLLQILKSPVLSFLCQMYFRHQTQ